jgi:hypothetical protein
MAGRVLPQGVNVTVSGGKVNTRDEATGLSGIDYDFDRAVGESARRNWQGISERQRDKIEVIQTHGVTGWDLSRNPDGTYRVMTPEERRKSETARAFHEKMLEHARKQGRKP